MRNTIKSFLCCFCVMVPCVVNALPPVDGAVVSIVRGDPDCPQNCESQWCKFYPAIKPNDFMTYYENRR